MQPVGNYIQINKLPEVKEDITREKQPLILVEVHQVSPDIQMPFTTGHKLLVAESKIIEIEGTCFIQDDYCYLSN